MAKGSLKFLADENISPKLVAVLRHLGDRTITSVSNLELAGKPDAEWLPAATRRGYVCISCDCRMMAELALAQILLGEKARVIFLGNHFSGIRRWEQAIWLLRYWRSIKEFAESMTEGQLVRVNKNGKIVAVKPGRKAQAPPRKVPRKKITTSNNGTGQGILIAVS